MLVLALSLLLCGCASGQVGGANEPGPSPLAYETFVDAGRYLFVPTPQNWTDASKVCALYNGHLAYPKTQEEADALWTIMAQYHVQEVHAGFHDQYKEGEYYTAKGRLINETSFNQWAAGYPTGGTELNCGGLRGGGLVDQACKDSLPSICEENQQEGPGGFLDYLHVPGHGYYKLYSEWALWPDAMRACYDQGAHLWIVNSEDERAAVSRALGLSSDVAGVWVGVHQLHADGYFVTVFGDSLESTGYSKWSGDFPGGPNSYYPYVTVTHVGLTLAKLSRYYLCEHNNNNNN